MRRHPLSGRPVRLVGLSLLGSLLVACLASPAATPVVVVGVTIASAPGETLAFVPAETAVRATGPIALAFRNESSLPHNLVFTAGPTAATRTIVEPGDEQQLLLEPLAPDRYPFVCTIHDGMAGTLVVLGIPAGAGATASRVAAQPPVRPQRDVRPAG